MAKQVCILFGNGISDTCANITNTILFNHKILCEMINIKDLDKLNINKFSTLIIGGGFPKIIMKELGSNKKIIKKFIKDGGTYIGICAGAVIMTSNKSNLSLTQIKCINDNKYARMGLSGSVKLKFNLPEEITNNFPPKFHYEGGPIMKNMSNEKINIIASFDEDLVKNHIDNIEIEEQKNKEKKWICIFCLHCNYINKKKCENCAEYYYDAINKSHLPNPNEMPNTIAVCELDYYKGKIFLLSIHPELSGNGEHLLVYLINL
jgi:glutamine amidotransferase PdxT